MIRSFVMAWRRSASSLHSVRICHADSTSSAQRRHVLSSALPVMSWCLPRKSCPVSIRIVLLKLSLGSWNRESANFGLGEGKKSFVCLQSVEAVHAESQHLFMAVLIFTLISDSGTGINGSGPGVGKLEASLAKRSARSLPLLPW